LLAADAPSLRTLDVSECGLCDEGLAPLLDGLAVNTHLETLLLLGSGETRAFTAARIRPAAAAASPALRTFYVGANVLRMRDLMERRGPT
jgi:hypothetical protein